MKPTEEAWVAAQKASIIDALKGCMVGPTTGETARKLAPIVLKAIEQGEVPFVTLSLKTIKQMENPLSSQPEQT